DRRRGLARWWFEVTRSWSPPDGRNLYETTYGADHSRMSSTESGAAGPGVGGAAVECQDSGCAAFPWCVRPVMCEVDTWKLMAWRRVRYLRRHRWATCSPRTSTSTY